MTKEVERLMADAKEAAARVRVKMPATCVPLTLVPVPPPKTVLLNAFQSTPPHEGRRASVATVRKMQFNDRIALDGHTDYQYIEMVSGR